MKPLYPEEFDVLPIHLQMRDAYPEMLLARRLGAVDAYAYGVVEMFFDTTSLSDGHLAFTSLQAIMPSKLPVLHVEPRRDVLKSWPKGATSLDLFLAVRPVTLRGPNVRTLDGHVCAARYEEIATEEGSYLRPIAELLFEHEPLLEQMESILLGRIRREGTALVVDPDVLPTLAGFHAAEAWRPRLGRFLGFLEQRERELLADREDHPLQLESVTWEQLPPLRLLVALRGYLSTLTDFYLHASARPRELHRELHRFYAELRSFGATETIPPYSHERPTDALSALFEHIRTTVDKAARDTAIRIPFTAENVANVGRVYRATFSSADVHGKRPYLVAECSVEELLQNDVPLELRIGSPSKMRDMQIARDRGVGRAIVFSVPPEIPNRTGVVAYSFDEGSSYWSDILNEQEILMEWAPQTTRYWQRVARHHPPDASPPDVSFVLYWVDSAR
ncbi:type VI secretion system baseplate subunit TssK [Pendulispora rubella]|uniref:Type VI secretion system baseplate subunit TssK n=1 Tax=Pendulispora rubella TaxID=2741070 RepID=A0ABZ2KXU2_9BACT